MKNVVRGLLFLFIFINSQLLHAAEFGTPKEAEAMVKKAALLIQEKGEAAYAEISAAKGAFVDRDMYVYVTDLKGRVLAHGATPKVVGKDISDIRDPKGKYVMKEILKVASTTGKGWIDYEWPNIITKTVEAKSTYFEKVGEVVIACGILKK